MKTANFTISLMLAACFTLPAMGYEPNIPGGKVSPTQPFTKRLERIESKGKHYPYKQPAESRLARIDSKGKGAKVAVSHEQLERLIERQNCLPVTEKKDSIAPCQCIQNATEEDMLNAEAKLQRIRDMKNSNASFETYPQLLQQLCTCTNCTCPKETPQQTKATKQPVVRNVSPATRKDVQLTEVQQQRLRDMQEEGPSEEETHSAKEYPPYW